MFENMSVSDVKTYIRERGVSVNGYLKPALTEIAKAVQKMMLPIVTEFKNGNDNEDMHNFIIHDMEIRDTFSASCSLVNNFVDSPPFGLYDGMIFSTTQPNRGYLLYTHENSFFLCFY